MLFNVTATVAVVAAPLLIAKEDTTGSGIGVQYAYSVWLLAFVTVVPLVTTVPPLESVYHPSKV